jgi:hypothetical protein
VRVWTLSSKCVDCVGLCVCVCGDFQHATLASLEMILYTATVVTVWIYTPPTSAPHTKDMTWCSPCRRHPPREYAAVRTHLQSSLQPGGGVEREGERAVCVALEGKGGGRETLSAFDSVLSISFHFLPFHSFSFRSFYSCLSTPSFPLLPSC